MDEYAFAFLVTAIAILVFLIAIGDEPEQDE